MPSNSHVPSPIACQCQATWLLRVQSPRISVLHRLHKSVDPYRHARKSAAFNDRSFVLAIRCKGAFPQSCSQLFSFRCVSMSSPFAQFGKPQQKAPTGFCCLSEMAVRKERQTVQIRNHPSLYTSYEVLRFISLFAVETRDADSGAGGGPSPGADASERRSDGHVSPGGPPPGQLRG